MAAYTLQTLASRFDVALQGQGNVEITHVTTLQQGGEGGISFLTNDTYRPYLTKTTASAVIVAPKDSERCQTNALITDNPHGLYARIAQLFAPPIHAEPGAHPSAVIADDAEIDPTASIGPLCVIESGVTIAANVVIGPHCIIQTGTTIDQDTHLVADVTVCHHTKIGKRVVLHPGAVIGADGFGFAMDQGHWEKVPQFGCVILADDVDIGANTTIDRGAIDDTVIENDVKIDNQVVLGHNVRVGAHSVIAGRSGIAGSTTVGQYCMIGGDVGVVGHIHIPDKTVLMGGTRVHSKLPKADVYCSGTSAEPAGSWRRNSIRFKQLDQMAKRLAQLEKQLNTLQKDN